MTDDATPDDNAPHEPVAAATENSLVVRAVESPLSRWQRLRRRIVLPPVISLGAVSLIAGAVGRAGWLTDGGPLTVVGVLTLAVLPTVIAAADALLTEPTADEPVRKRGTLRAAKVAAVASFALSLLAAPIYQEGVICLLIFTPINMVLSTAAALAARALLKERLKALEEKHRKALALLIAIALPWAAPSLDNALFGHGASRETVTSTVTLPFSQRHVWDSLRDLDVTFAPPPRTSWLALLPEPQRIHGGGAEVGAVRHVDFENGSVRARVIAVAAPVSYEVALTVENPGREFFNHWVTLEDSRFELFARDGAHTALVHTTHYRPLLFPRVLFRPIEQFFGRCIQNDLVNVYVLDVLQRAALPAPNGAVAVDDAWRR